MLGRIEAPFCAPAQGLRYNGVNGGLGSSPNGEETRLITLSPRLAAVASYVLLGKPMADIGTDHGYLPAHLVQAGHVPRAIAGDLMPGPLDAARATIREAGLLDQVELRLGSGLQVLRPGEVMTATICGMGGALIAEILDAGPLAGIERLVLQPMGGEERLRAWLADNGWALIDEQLLAEGGRLYVVLVAEPGPMRLTEAELLIGPHLQRHGGPLLIRHAEVLVAQLERAMAGARQSDRPEAQERLTQLTHRMQLIQEVITYARTEHP
jgi:tRNA (adenine22-N1)-methyltransferase